MYFDRKSEPVLTDALFRDPPCEYRGAPFWAWNEKLDARKLTDQVAQFREMGMGGFHIHCRSGLDTRYLGEAFFECVKAVVSEAKAQGLRACLYDEDRWPSGSAGGLVTREREYRIRFLLFSPLDSDEVENAEPMSSAKALHSGDKTLLGVYEVVQDAEGYLVSYRRLEDGGDPPAASAGAEGAVRLWKAELEISGTTPWHNDQTYVDTMNPKAIERFIRLTHEQYRRALPGEFGQGIRTIFTDEPQTVHKTTLDGPFDLSPVILPYTDDFDETFSKTYGYSLMDKLPELIWETRDAADYHVRHDYHTHATERYAQAFCDQIGDWCQAHGIGLTGHMMGEWTLQSQTSTVGECMRPLRRFQLPGVDMLCDRREFSTLKQAQSVAHQYGREGVMSELYGVTGWHFDFRNHKLAGDWQAALGVVLRVHHLTWVSMEGEAKRDYPASIGRQSPWYREYSAIEDHFARLNTAMVRGRAVVRVGVIHPVESYWMRWGNKQQTALERHALESGFFNVIDWLLFGLIDFDFIAESLLEEIPEQTDPNGFHMGQACYQVIVVPQCSTLRRHTLESLRQYMALGGRVIFLGDAPEYVDARLSGEGARLAAQGVRLPMDQARLLAALEEYRDVGVEVFSFDGGDESHMKFFMNENRATNLFYQLRQDGDDRWLFLCHVKRPVNDDIASIERWRIRLRGEYAVLHYDTMSGEIQPLPAEYSGGDTLLDWYSSQQGSLLLKLSAGRSCAGRQSEPILPVAPRPLPEPCAFRLAEDNVFLLDQAEYAFDDGEWQPREELLRIDNLFRRQLGYPLRMEALAQLWTHSQAEAPSHRLRLRFRIPSEIRLEGTMLAMEHPESARITWNGRPVPSEARGWFVDECIRTLPLPDVREGDNTLELEMPFGRKTNVEWMYLLGKYGVRVAGSHARLCAWPERLVYGDIVPQGFPFYGGNLEYDATVRTESGELFLEASMYRGALLRVWLDGEDRGRLFLAPYRMSLGRVAEGEHRITIRVYGNRSNTFGPLHNADATESWYGPNLWRTNGTRWSYPYRLREAGLIKHPEYWCVPDPR